MSNSPGLSGAVQLSLPVVIHPLSQTSAVGGKWSQQGTARTKQSRASRFVGSGNPILKGSRFTIYIHICTCLVGLFVSVTLQVTYKYDGLTKYNCPNGFENKIWTTRFLADLVDIILRPSDHLQDPENNFVTNQPNLSNLSTWRYYFFFFTNKMSKIISTRLLELFNPLLRNPNHPKIIWEHKNYSDYYDVPTIYTKKVKLFSNNYFGTWGTCQNFGLMKNMSRLPLAKKGCLNHAGRCLSTLLRISHNFTVPIHTHETNANKKQLMPGFSMPSLTSMQELPHDKSWEARDRPGMKQNGHKQNGHSQS